MNTSDLKQFKARMDNDATSITEADIASMHETLSKERGERWFRMLMQGWTGVMLSVLKDLSLIFSVFPFVLLAISMVFFHATVTLSSEVPKGILALSLVSLSVYATLWRLSWRPCLVNDVNDGLSVLSSSDADACQKVLDLSEAVPVARNIRSGLLAANRPIRAMHLRAMERLDLNNLAAQVAARREANTRSEVCKAAHGIQA